MSEDPQPEAQGGRREAAEFATLRAANARVVSAGSQSGGPVRVAFCLPGLARGGMERVTLALVEGLLAQGFAVDVVLERAQGEYLDELPAGARLFVWRRYAKHIAYRQLISAWPVEGSRQLCRSVTPNTDYLPLRRLPSMVAYFRDEKPDIVFASHGRVPILTLLARGIARARAPVVVVEHSTLSRWLDVFRDQPGKYRRWRYRCDLARRLYPEADRIVGVSRGVADDLVAMLGLDPARVMTLYNPVASDAALATDRGRPDHPWFAPGEPPVVLAVGRLVEEKNFEELIDAFAQLRQRRRVRLMVLGEGEMRGRLEARIRDARVENDVCLPGWSHEPQRYMRASSVFVLSSLFEGLGIVLIEAMACGCPVVSVDCPSGPREILDDGRYGPLVPLHDVNSLADAIDRRLDAPRHADRLKARAGDFSIEHGVAAYRDLIETLVPAGHD